MSLHGALWFHCSNLLSCSKCFFFCWALFNVERVRLGGTANSLINSPTEAVGAVFTSRELSLKLDGENNSFKSSLSFVFAVYLPLDNGNFIYIAHFIRRNSMFFTLRDKKKVYTILTIFCLCCCQSVSTCIDNGTEIIRA